MAVGSFAAFQDSAGGQQPGTTFAAVDFATESSDADGIATRSASGTFRVDEAGCFLVLFNLDVGSGTGRECIQARLTYGGSGDFVAIHGTGYTRNSINPNAGITGWGLVRNAAANDTFQLGWRRDSDDGAGSSVANASYFVIIRLHDSPSVGMYKNLADNAAYNSQTWTAAPYATTVVQNDTASIERTSNTEFTLKKNALYLIGYAVNINNDLANDRTQRITRLNNTTDLRPLEWSYGYGYGRDNSNQFMSPHALCLWKNDGTNTVISVEAQRGDADYVSTDASRDSTEDDGIFIIELPALVEGIISYDQTGGDDYNVTPPPSVNAVRTVEHNDAASFTKASSAAINCESAMDVLVGASIFGNRANADATRLSRGAKITVAGTAQDVGGDIYFLRGDDTAPGTDDDTFDICLNPWYVGAVTSGQDLGVDLIDEGEDGTGGDETTTASRVGMWAINLDTLSSGTAPSGAGVQTLPAMSQAGTGVLQPSATATQTLPSLNQAGTGRAEAEGSGAQTLAALTQAGSGSQASGPSATAALTLARLAQAGTGALQPQGTAAQTLAAISQAGAGDEIFRGSAAQTLARLAQQAGGGHEALGSGGQTLAALTQAGTGIFGTVSGAGALTLAPLAQAGTGLMRPQAGAAQTLAALAQQGTGALPISGAGASGLPAIVMGPGVALVIPIAVNEYPGPQPIPAQPDITGIVRVLRGAFMVLNNLLQGKMNNTGVMVLTPGAAATVVNDARMTINSVLYFDPLSASAAQELAAGTMVALKTGRRNGTFTVTHANNAQNDRAYRYEIKG
jgi:hypothetical protein